MRARGGKRCLRGRLQSTAHNRSLCWLLSPQQPGSVWSCTGGQEGSCSRPGAAPEPCSGNEDSASFPPVRRTEAEWGREEGGAPQRGSSKSFRIKAKWFFL
ncbi:hypothetical protein NDU88_012585 [Pleurodeles waltl]|uniref:Uncharacterized protein n=1 Tax=Pleurodeles waltl TaxID=8319 RepID=A0AAV7R687_PLEWA|nr:hypothetical protein NDU88_012585 [Pleurodeles waltl]